MIVARAVRAALRGIILCDQCGDYLLTSRVIRSDVVTPTGAIAISYP